MAGGGVSVLVGMGTLGSLPANAVVGDPAVDGERPYADYFQADGVEPGGRTPLPFT